MKASILSLLIACSVLAASCPLGFTPEEACSADNPSCALFVDENGDSLCDNPGPQPEVDSQTEVEEAAEDSTEAAEDSLDMGDAVSEEDSSFAQQVQDISSYSEDTTFSDSSSEESAAEENGSNWEETVPVVTDQPDYVEVISSDEEGHLRCLNPVDLTESDDLPTIWEVHYWITDSSTITEEIQIEISEDFVYVDTVTTEKEVMCPLGFTPDEACSEDAPSCALFVDEDGDSICDNPGVDSDTSAAVNVNVSGSVYRIVPVASGCPRGLPPEAACPVTQTSLCPHYMEKPGVSGCINPSGTGIARTAVVLAVTILLLIISTYLRRRFCRMGRRGSRSRNIAHTVIQIVSLLLLGFLVQGCFCPLGAIQYTLLPEGLIFLGILGIGVLLVPMIWSAFFDRVYCGWVCPFGALQDMLGKLKVPRPRKFPHRVHRVLSGIKYLLALLFFGTLILASSGQLGNLVPEAFFCVVDPFHTVFSFFVVGSTVVAVTAICILIFFPRFFCKYLCFYGAILSFLGRIGLWKRITHKGLPESCQDEETEDLEFPAE